MDTETLNKKLRPVVAPRPGSFSDPAHHAFRDPKLTPKHELWLTIDKTFLYLCNLIVGKWTLLGTTRSSPTLSGDNISGVILYRPCVQMVRIAAGAVIAFVTNNQPFWNDAAGKLEREPVADLDPPKQAKLPIPVLMPAGHPFPALGWAFNVHLLPKALVNGLLQGEKLCQI